MLKKYIWKKIVIGMGAGSISNWMRKIPELCNGNKYFKRNIK